MLTWSWPADTPVSQAVSYVVVELKQWTSAGILDGDPELCVPAGPPGRVVLNPIAQVRRYCEFLVDFVGRLQDSPDAVTGVAYLHNAVETNVGSLHDLPADSSGQLFTASSRGALLDLLRSTIAPYPPAADQLLSSKIGPSKQLIAVAAEEIQNRRSRNRQVRRGGAATRRDFPVRPPSEVRHAIRDTTTPAPSRRDHSGRGRPVRLPE